MLVQQVPIEHATDLVTMPTSPHSVVVQGRPGWSLSVERRGYIASSWLGLESLLVVAVGDTLSGAASERGRVEVLTTLGDPEELR